MVEYPLLKEAKNNNLDFNYVFADVKDKLLESDCLVGNLETPIAGKLRFYTNELYCFNTPDSFLKTLANCGFDILTTANNHCLDRGYSGLRRTIRKIKENNIIPLGTYLSEEDSKKVIVKDIDGVKVGFVTATYGTNVTYNKRKLRKSQDFCIDMLNNYNMVYNVTFKDVVIRKLKKILYSVLSIDTRFYIRTNIFNRNIYVPDAVIDNFDGKEFKINEKFLKKIDQKIKNTKKEADLVILLLHLGGQFNYEIGSYTKYIVDHFTEKEIDAIICAHPHNVQEIKKVNGKLVAFSLGNFLISPSTPYLRAEYLPTYSLILNLYVDKNSKKIDKVSYIPVKVDNKSSITKIRIVGNTDSNLQSFQYLLLKDVKMEKKDDEFFIY